MLVDDNLANLNMGKSILKDYYEVYALPSADRLFIFLEHVFPDLILLDIEMPGMNGFDAMRLLKADERYSGVPVIFVTSRVAEMDELEGLTLGAVDYVIKPFSAAILLKRIENHLLIRRHKDALKDFNENLIKMVKEKTSRIVELQNSFFSTLADIVEFRDDITGGHISRTHKYVQILIDKIIKDKIYTDQILLWNNMDFLLLSSQLHDIGKLAISDAILNKPGKLTPEEFDIMKTHTTKGVEVIKLMADKSKDLSFLEHAQIMAGTHHEKWDGSGYPQGLKEEAIPLEGRIMAIADVYDALTSARPYKKPFPAKEASRIIIEGSGTHFDPILVDVFKELTAEFAAV